MTAIASDSPVHADNVERPEREDVAKEVSTQRATQLYAAALSLSQIFLTWLSFHIVAELVPVFSHIKTDLR